LWHARCFDPDIMRSHSPRSHSEPILPFPLVPVEARRHILGDPVRTRLGIGDLSIDHAAGLPRDARSSWPPSSDWAVQPRSRGWSETPNPGRFPASSQPAWKFQDDSPVDLPMRSMSSAVIVAVAVFVAFIAVVLGTFFAGFSRTILVTDVEAAATPALRL